MDESRGATAALSGDEARWQAQAAYLQEQARQATEAAAAQNERALTLQAQLRDLEAYAADLQTALDQTQARLDAAAGAGRGAPPRPAIIDLVDQLPRSSDAANVFPRRAIARLRSLVIHRHAGIPAPAPQQLAEQHISDPRRLWPGIGFHFVVSSDGDVYQTNALETACYHIAEHNADSVGIVLTGGLESAAPPARQLASTAALLAWLMAELGLGSESIAGHSDFAGQDASCPGAGWQAPDGWKEALLSQVRAAGRAERRPIYHYLLFWQSATAWAEDDWQAAARYMGRFRPTAGFSIEEAKLAEHVTIIGGPGGVGLEAEQTLREAGCRVQRIAGKTTRQTRSLLDAMAGEGRRFLLT